jgi:hypothetical protein
MHTFAHRVLIAFHLCFECTLPCHTFFLLQVALFSEADFARWLRDCAHLSHYYPQATVDGGDLWCYGALQSVQLHFASFRLFA